MFDMVYYIIEDIYLILLICALWFTIMLRLLYYVGKTLFRIIPENMMSILDALGLIISGILIYFIGLILVMSTNKIYNLILLNISAEIITI